ncbi:hypothetical protein DFJ74DRAFT_653586 [Hyaloraphidium curvatum]|nr:hypothetical protein DFJ74DRAFT_653586 [Hyaloraphidium curvatum]
MDDADHPEHEDYADHVDAIRAASGDAVPSGYLLVKRTGLGQMAITKIPLYRDPAGQAGAKRILSVCPSKDCRYVFHRKGYPSGAQGAMNRHRSSNHRGGEAFEVLVPRRQGQREFAANTSKGSFGARTRGKSIATAPRTAAVKGKETIDKVARRPTRTCRSNPKAVQPLQEMPEVQPPQDDSASSALRQEPRGDQDLLQQAIHTLFATYPDLFNGPLQSVVDSYGSIPDSNPHDLEGDAFIWEAGVLSQEYRDQLPAADDFGPYGPVLPSLPTSVLGADEDGYFIQPAFGLSYHLD